jgi:hypothetical protein
MIAGTYSSESRPLWAEACLSDRGRKPGSEDCFGAGEYMERAVKAMTERSSRRRQGNQRKEREAFGWVGRCLGVKHVRSLVETA